MRSLLVFALAWSSLACGDTPEPVTALADVPEVARDTAVALEDTADAAVADTRPAEDTARACPLGTHPVADGCDATLSWEELAPVDLGRDHHGTVVVEAGGHSWLVVVGGWIGDGITGAVSRAEIGEDGAPGRFTDAAADVPGGVAGHGVVALGDRIVITGGKAAGSGLPNVATTRVARVDGRGAVGTWEVAGDLPAAVFHGNLAGEGDRVWATGGLAPQGPTDFVVTAALDADGHLGAWQATTPLPTPLSHHASLVHDGALYVVGGLTGDPAGAHTTHDEVWRAPIAGDGTLGAWAEVGTMPTPVGTHSAVVFGDRLWVLGGVVGPATAEAFSSDVFRAAFDAHGGVRTWETLADALPVARAHVHQTPVWRDRLYSVGGRASEAKTALTLLWMGTFE